MLREGNWEGKQLLSKDAVQAITSDAGTPGNCSMGWWSNNSRVYSGLPADAFWGSGAGHQIVLVVPSLKLIVVRNGEQLGAAAAEPSKYHEPVRELLFEPLIDAITDPDRAAAKRAFDAMMTMRKIDIATIEAARRG